MPRPAILTEALVFPSVFQRLKASSPYYWPVAKSRYYGKPLVLFHSGLGPGDTSRHSRGRPEWYIKELEKIAKEIHLQIRRKNSSAGDLCEFAVRLLEDNPAFNAGTGAKLQADGQARLSCAYMNGKEQKLSAVCNIREIKNPSRLVRLLNSHPSPMLAANEASRFAFENALPPISNVTNYRREEWLKKLEGKTGAVGCVAIDRYSHTAAMTSTGGRGMETPGRISDTGTPAGNFATPFGAVSATGRGEDIVNAGLAVAILSRLEDQMSLQEAVSRSFLRHSQKLFAVISVDRNGNALVHATHGTIGFGVVTEKNYFCGLDSKDWFD